MRFEVDNDIVTIYKTSDKERYYKETAIWYEIKKMFNKTKRYDLIKKNTTKDGHLFGDANTYYLRDRNWRYCLVDYDYAIRQLHKEFNINGIITLTIVNLER